MPQKTILIESILGGYGQTQYQSSQTTFNSSIAIDPDLPLVPTDIRTSGAMVPVAYSKFSGTEITGFPLWIISQIKTENSFIYTSDGKLHSFNNSIVMRTTDEASTAFPITITGGNGTGAVYYNNFIYLAEGTDISQYGGMSTGASIAKTENVWTGAKFGLTALTNTTYPSLKGVAIPNHAMHHHADNAVYICDVVNGQGVIHKLKTKRTTIEGDTNDASVFNALDLPFGYFPTDIESFGTDLIISAIQTSSSSINQGKAALFLWDTISDSFYRGPIFLPDPLVTALLNVNGNIYIFSGNASNGCRLSIYEGGFAVRDLVFFEEGVPPFAGAVDALGSRLVWGGSTTYPITTASVFSYGSKDSRIPSGLHNIVNSTAASTNRNISALKYIQQASNIIPRVIVGWGDDTNKGLDKFSETGTLSSVWRSGMFNINSRFKINSIRIPLGATLSAGHNLTVKILLDDLSSNITLPVINSTNFSGRKVSFKQSDLASAVGVNNFLIEFSWSSTTQLPILLPIQININIEED